MTGIISARRVWIARLLIGGVVFWNLQAAAYFILRPDTLLVSFQLEGVPGQAAIVGYGILFLMWSVPYVFALIRPQKYRISLWEALIMQTIGTAAESILLSTIPLAYVHLRRSILRFLVFDGVGVLLLAMALIISRKQAARSIKD